MAIRETPGGTRWTVIIKLADMFTEFIINGTVPANDYTLEDK